jgi:hypothetical protein
MKLTFRQKYRAFTLLELSIAISIGIMIGAMLIALFNQQLAFLDIYRRQSFLIEEAPIINAHVSRLIGKADRFRLHPNTAAALGGVAVAVQARSPALELIFRQPDGSIQRSVLAYEGAAPNQRLNYYTQQLPNPIPNPPPNPAPVLQWSITGKTAQDVVNGMPGVSFLVVNGVLQMTLRGPVGEMITYSGTSQS